MSINGVPVEKVNNILCNEIQFKIKSECTQMNLFTQMNMKTTRWIKISYKGIHTI